MKLVPFLALSIGAFLCNSTRESPQTPPPATPILTTGSETNLDKEPKVVTARVSNKSAKILPQPEYPPAARAVKAKGTVSVQVLVDETGKVVSATAVSGHALLRPAAVQAARKAEFEPLIIYGQAKTASGVLTYTFEP